MAAKLCPFCAGEYVAGGGTCSQCGTSVPKDARRTHRSDKAYDKGDSAAAIDHEYHGDNSRDNR